MSSFVKRIWARRWVLWCVAFNGADHGGKRVLDPKNPDRTNFSGPDYAGDWVWDFPE